MTEGAMTKRVEKPNFKTLAKKAMSESSQIAAQLP
jgi:hypothetical protein